jgi:acyl-CoA oxidase
MLMGSKINQIRLTFQGDNTVLTLQCGRYLIGCYRDKLAGKTLPLGVGYLNQLPEILSQKCTQDPTNLNVVSQGFDVVVANLVKRAGDAFETLLKQGKSEDEAYEGCAMLRFQAAKLHCSGYLFHRFFDGLKNAPEGLKPILVKVCSLYGLYTIQENSGAFLQYRYFEPKHIEIIQGRVMELCQQVRYEAVSLVDSFNFSDYIVNSPIGRYDGDIYKHYFDLVKRNNPQGVPPYFETVLKPLLQREQPVEDRIEIDEE